MMRKLFRHPIIVIGLASLFTGFASAEEASDRVQAAIAADRPDEDVARDPDRKPAAVLEFYDIKPGDVVVDLFSGGGYYTELFSHLVGPEGTVYAQNSPSRYERSQEALDARYQPLGNVEAMPADLAEGIPLDDDSVDHVFIFLIYHHLHYDEETPDSMPERSAALYEEVKRVLKPGGTFGLIEHDAVAGASRAVSAEWHRAPVAIAKADLSAAGFEFVAESDALTNDTDPRNSGWRDIRGKTSRWVLKYRSPE